MKFDLQGLRQRADNALSRQEASVRRLSGIYALVWAGLYLAGSLISMYLTESYSGLSGLSTMDKGSRLLAGSMLVSLLASALQLLLNVGYCSAVLKLSQGQPAQERELLLGINQLPRLFLCLGSFMITLLAVSYLLLTLVLLLIPQELWLKGDSFSPLLMGVGCGVCIAVYGWLLYNRRLLFFVLAKHQEHPGCLLGKTSTLLLKGFRLQFLRIDLKHWGYYLSYALISAIPYGVILLPLESKTAILVADAVGMLLVAVLMGLLYYKHKTRLWVTYALAFSDVWAEKTRHTPPSPGSPIFPGGGPEQTPGSGADDVQNGTPEQDANSSQEP